MTIGGEPDLPMEMTPPSTGIPPALLPRRPPGALLPRRIGALRRKAAAALGRRGMVVVPVVPQPQPVPVVA